MSSNYSHILEALPYSQPFLFVDALNTVSEEGCTGSYQFPANSFFYEGHFKDHPVTPGVILTECMAQIGLVCLGVFLLNSSGRRSGVEATRVALADSNVTYLQPVYPEETVTVVSEKVYFRFGKLKCKVKMLNASGETVCHGEMSGMVVG
ncbi:MAG: 3-hydroxyacyl-ACP dehydratase FabZ family protein [Bacteroidota bacterium]